MSRPMKIVVICSLVVNVLLTGVILGNLSTRSGGKKLPQRPGQELVGKVAPERLKMFEEAMFRAHQKNREIFEQIEASRKKVLSLLTEPEFNASAYQAEVNKLHDLRGLTMQNLANVTIDIAKHFTLEERKALAEILKRPPMPTLPPLPARDSERPDGQKQPPSSPRP